MMDAEVGTVIIVKDTVFVHRFRGQLLRRMIVCELRKCSDCMMCAAFHT